MTTILRGGRFFLWVVWQRWVGRWSGGAWCGSTQNKSNKGIIYRHVYCSGCKKNCGRYVILFISIQELPALDVAANIDVATVVRRTYALARIVED